MQNKVSIIIPLYNRERLIIDTLDSILFQKGYQNWECIIVDDQSEDKSFEKVQEFIERDKRFKLFRRPESLPSGANSSRNYGFLKSTGDYVIWFDSDDLMSPSHLKQKVAYLESNDLDFVVAKTQNFEEDKKLKPYKYFKPDYGITASDFILLKIHWYTYDVLLKRKIAEKISWNEKMKSWQDYNYFCKMLLQTVNGDYLNEILTCRRIHENSIQKRMNRTKLDFNRELLENRVFTYEDINNQIDKHTKLELLYGMMNLSFELAKARSVTDDVARVKKMVKAELGRNSSFYFNLALKAVEISGKGYQLLDKAKKKKN